MDSHVGRPPVWCRGWVCPLENRNAFLPSLLSLCAFSHIPLFITSWTVAHQAPLSMGFPRQEYWSVGCHFLLHGIFLTQGSKLCLLCFLHWQLNSLPQSHLRSPSTSLLWLRNSSCASKGTLSSGPSRNECMRVRVCVHACVCVCVHACVCACVCVPTCRGWGGSVPSCNH